MKALLTCVLAFTVGFLLATLGTASAPSSLWTSSRKALTSGAGTAVSNVRQSTRLAAAAGPKLSGAKGKLATHICVDCGYIYAVPTPFEKQPASYRCPECGAAKDRFATYDPATGKQGSVGIPGYLLWSVVGSAALIGGLLYAASLR